jgi:hypothetical protein
MHTGTGDGGLAAATTIHRCQEAEGLNRDFAAIVTARGGVRRNRSAPDRPEAVERRYSTR